MTKHKRIPIAFKDSDPRDSGLGGEHLHIYKWREELKSMTCDCGKPIPTGGNKPYYGR